MGASFVESATPAEMPVTTERKVTTIFTREEIRMLNERSDWRGLWAVGFTWAVVVATGAGLVWATSQPLFVVIPAFVAGFVLLGGRHLSLAILHHEAAHQSLFRTRWLNETVGDWLCARPGWNDLKRYRAHHFDHHRKTRQPQDPDRSLVEAFPTTRASLVRKLARDLFGVTGLKYLIGRTLMDAGVLKWTVASDVVWLPREGRRWWSYPVAFFANAKGTLLVNGVLLATCWATGHAWLYAIWALSYLTPFPLFLRIRSLAEHACTDASTDMFLNTRTTRAGLLARATVAPVHVNFHIEHHVLPGVPYFRLPRMHRMLRQRGIVAEPPTYFDVLRIVSAKRAAGEDRARS